MFYSTGYTLEFGAAAKFNKGSAVQFLVPYLKIETRKELCKDYSKYKYTVYQTDKAEDESHKFASEESKNQKENVDSSGSY